MRNFFAGKVSRTTLLTGLLLGFASFFSTVMLGILMYPGTFDWRKRVMSRALSPERNPDAYWIPALGVAAAALLFLPFAGYVRQRLCTIAPRGARGAGVAFTWGILLLLGVALPLPADLPPGMERLHEVFARGSAAALMMGALCCCACAFKDRLRVLGGQRRLRDRLALCWMVIPLMLVALGLICGVMLLGRQAGMEWALQARDVLRPTLLWQLAFWEWVGMVAFFVFLLVSALWLPEHAQAPAASFASAPNFSEADQRDPALHAPASVSTVKNSPALNAEEIGKRKLIRAGTSRSSQPWPV